MDIAGDLNGNKNSRYRSAITIENNNEKKSKQFPSSKKFSARP